MFNTPSEPFNLDAVMERNRALYGDLRMEAEGEDGGSDEQPPAETVDGQEPDPTTEEPPAGEQEDADGDDSTLSHEDALKALEKVRKSEAKYRTRLREAEQKLADAKTPEEVAAAIDQIKAANASDARDLLVENIALRHGLPDDLGAALKSFNGNTREELEAHAKILAKYATVSNPPAPDELGGGLDPSDDGDGGTFDPAEAARKARMRRY
jgi:hypothetical protein